MGCGQEETTMAKQSFSIDLSHSNVGFTVKHMVFTKTHGSFQKFEGEIVFDPENPAASSVDVTIDAASIQTKDEKRDAHLRSADFFDVEKFPTLRFVSKMVEKDGDDYRVTGDLTIHGVTREVVLAAEYSGSGKDPWGGLRAGFAAKTTISRKDFGLTWNAVLETGGLLVGDKIEIHLDVEAV